MSYMRWLNQQLAWQEAMANAYAYPSRQPHSPPPQYSWPGSDHNAGPAPHHEGPTPPQNAATPPSEHDDPPSPPPPPGPHDHAFGTGFPFGGRRGGFHRGGHHGYRGHHHGPHGHQRRGGPDFWGEAGKFDMSKLANFISQFVPEDLLANLVPKDAATGYKDGANANGKDFTPPADIFDTRDAYVVHVSLPGAKKEDVGVNWDADKSELNIAGVVYRPGDEEFLKTLALDERKVGVFDRKVKLGSKAAPANVDSDGISAKMEDGVLLITIPKNEEFVDVKKVDIE